MPCVRDEALTVDGPEYLLGDNVTSETDVVTAVVLQPAYNTTQLLTTNAQTDAVP